MPSRGRSSGDVSFVWASSWGARMFKPTSPPNVWTQKFLRRWWSSRRARSYRWVYGWTLSSSVIIPKLPQPSKRSSRGRLMVLTQGAGKEEKVYAMQTDYCKIFSDHVNRLYTLALLLTADYAKAEQCFVAGLEDCVEGNPEFREWGKVWAARMIIKNAIRMISSSKNETITNLARQSALEADVLVSGITGLPPFERVAYVTSVLEGYSDR